MAKAYVTTPIDSQIYDRLHARRKALSGDLLRGEVGVGLGATIGMLLDHWEQHPPPSLEWIRETGKLYPQRGRPRSSEEGPRVRVGGKNDLWRGHDFVIPRAHPHMHFCRACDGFWDQSDYQRPLHPCPVHAPSPCRLMKRKLEEYLMVGFTEDEVTWETG